MAAEENVKVRVVVKAKHELSEDTPNTSITFRGLLPNLTNGISTTYHYVGIGHNVNDWLYLEGVAGLAARPQGLPGHRAR